jgi:hypothetical protein
MLNEQRSRRVVSQLYVVLLTVEPKTASLFTQTAAAAAVPAKLDLPTAKTKDELIESLSKHPGKKELLQLELDTLGEDWLLALQDELTKPYFVAVSRSSSSMRRLEEGDSNENDIGEK